MTIKFNKRTHTYTLKGKKLQSVTTWIKSYFTPFDSSIAKYLARNRRAKGEQVTAWDIKREWKQTGVDGTLVHKQIQDYIEAGLVIHGDASSLHSKALQGIDFVTKTLKKEYAPVTELVVYDEELGLAGTIDLIIKHDGVVDIYDFKTNKTLRMSNSKKGVKESTKDLDDCNFTHYCLQLNTYAYILQRQGFKIGDLHIVHLKDDGYKLYPVPAMFKVVEEMIKEMNT